ncbi:HlyD family type I secretion periplasmic adaptor subunit [Tepidamorphus sp. 3E244]|uniref:HlyD family type I secretion periplasmic adaptor subunit n=1 Tax=Tepidamorphus sp. 3E244 TaxID=3385498 RepID=UPI0038FD12DF
MKELLSRIVAMLTKPDAQEPAGDGRFHRRCDAIAHRAHGTFLYTVSGGVVLFGLWAGLTQVDQVTRGAGKVVPQSNNQIIQHFEGGIVTDIFVRNGDRVEKGEPLLRIENSFSEAELSRVALEMKAARAKIARMEALTDGADAPAFPEDLVHDVPAIVERERATFRNKREQMREQLSIHDDQIRQKELELSELRSRWSSISKERALESERVENLRRLQQRGAVSRNDLLEAERGLQQLESQMSELTHGIPRTEAALDEVKGRRRETELNIVAEVEKERGEAELQLAKLREIASAMQDRNLRSDVVAPISGIVNRVFITTIGGVVQSGDQLVQLVPVDGSIAVEARLSPADRAEVWPGLPAVVKISAYDYSIYGGLKGKIIEISPDALVDEQGKSYFRVRLEADAGAFGAGRPVVPGMVADVDILTGRRSILSYLLKPLRNVRENALRQ